MVRAEGSSARRWLRWFTLGSGPLKRVSDRIQVAGRVIFALSFLVAPPVAVLAASQATAHYETVAAAERQERSHVRAVLLEEAPAAAPQSGASGDDATQPLVLARVAWTAPSGTSRDGLVPVRPGTASGATVRIWVHQDGDLTSAPLDRSGVAGAAAGTGAVPLVCIPLTAWLLYVALCALLDARRRRRWDLDWAAVEPDWHSRLL